MIAWTLEGLGMGEFRGGHADLAVPRLEASVSLFNRIGNRRDVAYVLGELGAAQCARGALDLGDLCLAACCAVLRDGTSALPAHLAPHIEQAERSARPSWKRGMILGFDRVAEELIQGRMS